MTLAPEPFKSTADWSGDSDPEATLPAKIHAQVRSSETTRRLSGIYRLLHYNPAISSALVRPRTYPDDETQ